MAKPKILLLDIETAPALGWVWRLFKENIGINQVVQSGYVLCWAAKWLDQKKLHYRSLKDSSEEDMLQGIYDLVNEADIVIHYNGDRFDMPTLNKEFALFDLDPPAPYQSIDLLKVVRKNFRLESNKMDYVCQMFGLGEKVSVTFELWRDCIAGDRKAWALMKKYNKQDVLLLESLYERLLPWITNHPNMALFLDKDRPMCTNCGSTSLHRHGVRRTKTQQYPRYQCQDCGTWVRGRKTEVDKDRRDNILTQAR